MATSKKKLAQMQKEMGKWTQEMAPELQPELSKEQLTEGIYNWQKQRAEHELQDRVVLFCHYLRYLMQSHKAPKKCDKETLFKLINSCCEWNTEKILSNYTRGEEKAPPEMIKLYLQYQKWREGYERKS